MAEIFYDYPLKSLNTFGFDVSARCFVKAHSEEEIVQLLKNENVKRHPLLIMGGGSNLLFTGNFEGAILQPNMQNIDLQEDTKESVLLRVGAGVVWDDLVARCVSNGWYGVENLSLIPGVVGAAPVQNIGAYGVEAKDSVEMVEYIDLHDFTIKTLSNAECSFGYRSSIFKQALKNATIITQVYFRLRKNVALRLAYGNLSETVAGMGGATLQNVREAVISIRRSKLPDPAEVGNAGSFFKNPMVDATLYNILLRRHPSLPGFPVAGGVKIPAGWLIEQCGFKGAQRGRGRVGVHPKQALVLVNYGGGTGGEVLALAREICEAVHSKFGVALEMEVNVV